MNVKFKKNILQLHAAHGGVLFTLLDSCMGVGALSLVCSSQKVVSTLEMKVSFLRAVKPGDKIIVKSTCLKRGNNILHMEASMYNQNDEVLAKSSGTFNAFPKEKGRVLILNGLESPEMFQMAQEKESKEK